MFIKCNLFEFINNNLIYHRPTKNRKAINVQTSADKLDSDENVNVVNNETCITFFRPHVSARNPHACNESTIPRKPTEFKIPCSVVLISMSHLVYGSTNPITKDSFTDDSNAVPHTNIMNM